jgi:hypothetical protein
MGIVIPWRERQPKSAAAPVVGAAGAGMILLFTGVRYERHGEADAAGSPERSAPQPTNGPARIRRRRRG